jgi:hypothetical protein
MRYGQYGVPIIPSSLSFFGQRGVVVYQPLSTSSVDPGSLSTDVASLSRSYRAFPVRRVRGFPYYNFRDDPFV